MAQNGALGGKLGRTLGKAMGVLGALAFLLAGCGGGGTSGGDAAGDRGTDTGPDADGPGASDAPAGDVPQQLDVADAAATDDAGATDGDAADAHGDAADAAPPSGGLRLNPDTVDFGVQKVGTTTPPVTVTVTNASASAVMVTSLAAGGTNAGDFATSNDTCAGHALAAQSACSFDVTFTPSTLDARSATVAVTSNDPASPSVLTLGGAGIANAPALAVSPAKLAFGLVVVGAASPPTKITLTNNGTAPVPITTAVLAGDQAGDFALGADLCTGKSLAPSASCTLSVTFSPHTICKASKATLTFTDGVPASMQVVALSGTGVGGTTGKFGAILYCTSPSAQPEKLAALPNGDVGFTEHGSRVSPAAVASVNTAVGVRENPQAVQGNGWAPLELNAAPDGTTAYFEENFGAGNGIFLDVIKDGGKSMLPLFAGVTGPIGVGPDGAFWIAADHMCEGTDTPFVKKVVPGMAAVDFAVPPSWIQVNLKTVCAATTVMTAGPDGNVWLGMAKISQSNSGFARLTTSGVFVDFLPTTAGDPVAATFGADGKLYALIGATRMSACRLSRFDAAGVETTVLSLEAGTGMSCVSLASGADGQLWRPGTQFNGTAFVDGLWAIDPKTSQTTFHAAPPAQYVVAGPDEGLWFNSGPSAVGRFDLGGGPARAFIFPKSVAFPSGPIGTPTSARTVTIRSTGTGPLTISKVALRDPNPTEFVLTDPCTGQMLMPGASCNLTVTSKPTRAGSATAALVIETDDAFGPQTVSLGKFSVPPAPTVSPALVSFAATAVGKHSGTVTVSLTNPAGKSVAVTAVNLRGAGAGDFEIVADHCGGTTVLAKGSCSVTVRFSPAAAGTRAATLNFIDAASPPTQTAKLTGVGQAPGGACVCTGAFVDPSVVDPAGTVTSPGGGYSLAVVSGDAQHPVASITVSHAGGAAVLAFVPPINSTWPTESPWGFSPDDRRFVVHYQMAGTDWIELFDLTSATPATHIWSSSIPIAPGATVNSPAGSIAFSPHGDYLAATQVQTPAGSLTQTVFLSVVTAATGTVAKTLSWSPYKIPQVDDNPNTSVDSAFWGFGPDDHSFTYVALDANGVPTLNLLGLPSGTLVQDRTFTMSVASYVQYGPCGEVLAVVDQVTDPLQVSPPNPVTITVYSTSAADAKKAALGSANGLPAANAGLSLAADATNYTAQSADFPNVVKVAANAGAAVCRGP
jgi:hypothetical protein